MWNYWSDKKSLVIGIGLSLLCIELVYSKDSSEPIEAAPPAPELYFGQTAPGETPILFAPGTLNSISPWVEATELSPDGNLFFVAVGNATYSAARLLYSKFDNGAWTPFTDAPFLTNFSFSHEPVFSSGGDTITFTGRYSADDNDLWVVSYTAGMWGTPVALPPPINSSAREWRGSRMSDGTLYFGSTRAIPGNNQIFRAYKDSTQNTVVEKLGAPINNGTYEGDPCIAPDGHFLIFYSGRGGGSTDLYVSFKNNAGGWAKPINLGSSFNSGNDEYGAHLSNDGRYLFYTRHTATSNQIFWVATSAIEKLAPPTATLLRFVGNDLLDSIGNHDGRAQAGETVLLSTTIRNAGLDAAGITGTLSTTDPYVTVARGTTTYPSLAWKAQAVSTTPFAVTIDPACPDPHILVLALSVNSASGGGFIDTILVYIGNKPGFGDDIEGGDGFWKHKAGSTGAPEQWHREVSRYYSASTSWKMGGVGSAAYVDKCDAGLYSPPFLLPEKPKLTFWHRIDAEQKDDTTAWDGAIVMISTGNGVWTALTPTGGYPFKLSSGTVLPEGTRCYSGSHDWTKAEFDLAAYSGVRQIMLRFTSDGAVTNEGWYVDDVRVSGCCEGLVGNVDCDLNDGTDIGDLTMLVDNLFITFTPLCCGAEANCDGIGGIDIGDLTALIDNLFITFTPLPACQ